MLHIVRDIRFRSIFLVALVVWAILAAVWYLTLGWDPAPVVRPLTRSSGEIESAEGRTALPPGTEGRPITETAAVEYPPAETSAAPMPAGPPSTSAPRSAEPVPASPPQTSSGSGGFLLQAGAFQRDEGARARIRELEAQGYTARLESTSTDGLVRVLVGPFPTRSEARRVQRLLEADGIGSFVRSAE